MKAAAHRLAPAAAMLLCIASVVFPASRASAQMPPQEQVTILQLPPVSPHWIATVPGQRPAVSRRASHNVPIAPQYATARALGGAVTVEAFRLGR